MSFPIGKSLLSAILIALGAVVTFAGVSEFLGEVDLRRNGVITLARAADWREKDGETSVRFDFSVPGHSDLFSSSDITGRRNLWARVDEEAWQLSKATGQIEVRYLASAPWVNRPTASEGIPMADSAAATAIGIGLLITEIFLVVSAFLEYHRNNQAKNECETAAGAQPSEDSP